MSAGFVDSRTLFIDATHIKAAANNKKYINREAKRAAKFYEKALREEIEKDRKEHGKKPLKDKDGNDPPGGTGGDDGTTVKESKTDPESEWFHKGEHKQVFAYTAETACDKNGWILGYTVHPGNEHDSTTFPEIYDKVRHKDLETVVLDAGYKTPAIAKKLLDDAVKPLFPYKRPMTKEDFFPKYEYISS